MARKRRQPELYLISASRDSPARTGSRPPCAARGTALRRGRGSLAGLPQAERADWQRLWADVQAVLAKAEGKGTQGK